MKKYHLLIVLILSVSVVIGQVPLSDMIEVKGGTFSMGNSSFSRESPTRNVTLSTFYMSKHVVTNVQFAEFLNIYGSQTVIEGEFAGKLLFREDSWGVENNNGTWQAAAGFEQFPAIKVTWYGAEAYCKWAGGRLPTEAEWEYAAKGGINKNAYAYSGSSTASLVAWFYDNSGHTNKQVGTKTANSIGLFDMSGNVYEWCSDWFGRYGDNLSPSADPTGPTSGVSKVIRGGYRSNGASDLHLTHRESISPDESYNFTGFRLVRNVLTPANQIDVIENLLFPNPAKEYVTIHTADEIKNLKIINTEGKLVFDNNVINNFFSVAGFPNGIYLVRILNNSDKAFVQKLLIDR